MASKIKEIISKLPEKDIIVYKNIIGAFSVKGLALLVSMMAMPAYMRFFSDQQVLGVWFTVLSVLTWILNFDLGIGNGLRNKLAAEFVNNNRKAIKEYISSAYWMIGTVVVLFYFLGSLAIPELNWNSFFNIEATIIDNGTLSQVVNFAFLGIMLQFLLRLISSIFYALQKSSINNFIALVTSFLQLLVAYLAPSGSPIQSLKIFSVSFIFCANLPLLIATIIVFSNKLRDCKPNIVCFSKGRAKEVLSLGGIFFICQILFMIIANTNEFFISQYTSPENVVDYQIYHKLFNLGGTLFMLALTPVWSAVSKAIAENDFMWLQKLSKRLKKLSFAAIFAEFLIIAFLQWIINIWLKEDAIQVNYVYATVFACFGAAMVYQSSVSTIANGTGRMKIQAICYGIGIILKFVIIHFGIMLTGEWIVVVAANAIILIPYCFIQQIDIDKFISRGCVSIECDSNSAWKK